MAPVLKDRIPDRNHEGPDRAQATRTRIFHSRATHAGATRTTVILASVGDEKNVRQVAQTGEVDKKQEERKLSMN